MDRRGFIAFEVTFWIARIFFLVVVVVACVTLINFFVKNELDATPTDVDLFVNSLIYSPSGISYLDPYTGRVLPGVVDPARLNSSVIEPSFDFAERVLASKVEIVTSLGNYSFFINKGLYERFIVVSSFGGRGGADVYSRSLPVVIINKPLLEAIVSKDTVKIDKYLKTPSIQKIGGKLTVYVAVPRG